MRRFLYIVYIFLFVLFCLFTTFIVSLDIAERFFDFSLQNEIVNSRLFTIAFLVGIGSPFIIGLLLRLKFKMKFEKWVNTIWQGVIVGAIMLILPFIIASSPGISEITGEYVVSDISVVNFPLIQVFLFIVSYFFISPLLVNIILLIIQRKKKSLIVLLRNLLFMVVVFGVFTGLGKSWVYFIREVATRDLEKITENTQIAKTSSSVSISHVLNPAYKCLYPKSIKYQVLDLVTGRLSALVQESYIVQKDSCTVVIIGQYVAMDEQDRLKEFSVVSEILIRVLYGKNINSTWEKPVHKIVDFSQSDEYFSENNADGYYFDNKIKIKQDIAYKFEVIVHEQLHAFSDTGAPKTYNKVNWSVNSGLDEAVTQYFTDEVMKGILSEYKRVRYVEYSGSVEELLHYVDKKNLESKYFSDDLGLLSEEVDSKTYDGALCSFMYYLDQAQVEINLKNSEKAGEKVQQAKSALKDESLLASVCR